MESTERAPPGAKVAKSNAEVAALADTVILSLPDGSVSQAVAREIADASPRKVKTVIDTSTIGIKALLVNARMEIDTVALIKNGKKRG